MRFQMMTCLALVGIIASAAGAPAAAEEPAAAKAPAAANEPATGPLAEYVARADDSYGWVKRREGAIGAGRYIELTLTSQTWKGIVWQHQLFLLLPSGAKADCQHGLLYITGGNWKDEYAQPPQPNEKLPGEATLFAAVAERLQTPVAVLKHCPQQPIFDGLQEDAIIALTFAKYLKTEDPTWPLLLPMTKSAARALDATQEVVKKEWKLDLKKFTVSGASKRGWTTWLTGAIDPRVVAIAPMVIDMLQLDKQLDLQKTSFGDLSEEVADYKRLKLDEYINTPRGQKLLEIVDPYRYRDRLTQPKLIVLGTNDRYWPLDACNLYWDDLAGEKYLLYCPNNGHGLKDYRRIFGSLAALQNRMTTGAPLPRLTWRFEPQADRLTLQGQCDVPPSKVLVWRTTAKTRDFRDSHWSSTTIAASGGKFSCHLETPDQGFSALYAEFVFGDEEETQFQFCTNVRIVAAKAEKK